MGRLIVDENKCKRDGICASEYPHGAPLLFSRQGNPRASRGAPVSLSDDGRVPKDEILPAAPAKNTQNHLELIAGSFFRQDQSDNAALYKEILAPPYACRPFNRRSSGVSLWREARVY